MLALSLSLTTIAASCANSSKLKPSMDLEVEVPPAQQVTYSPECYMGPDQFQPPQLNPEPGPIPTPKAKPPTPAEQVAVLGAKLQWSEWARLEAGKANAEWKRKSGNTDARFDKCRKDIPGVVEGPGEPK